MVFKKKVETPNPYWFPLAQADEPLVYIKEDRPTSRLNHPDFKWGGAGQADAYPSVVALRRSAAASATQWPKQNVGHSILLAARDATLLNDKHAVEKLFKVESGWINGLNDPRQQINPWDIERLDHDELPRPEFITTSGNLHIMVERVQNAVKLKTWLPGSSPALDLNYDTGLTSFVHMMATHKDDYYVLISSGGCSQCQGQGRDVYFPLTCPGDAWVHFKDKWSNDRVGFVPPLGTVTTHVGLIIREQPTVDSEMTGSIRDDMSVQLLGYIPTAQGMWARIRDGYIALQYKPHAGTSHVEYYTTWELDYVPDLRPRHNF